MPSDEFRLCYVDEPWAYFANVEPTEMWGDDWNDAPHDCNAGMPYVREGQQVVKVAYDADLQTVGTNHLSHYGYVSAQDINEGRAPWLIQPSYGLPQFPKPLREVHAGITLGNFKLLAREVGGTVYVADPGPAA